MHGSARRLFIAAVAALLLGVGPGCSRKFFRERADADVAGVITQKNRFPAWAVKNWHAYPDPRARFADPFNPDRPPYPPDDYAARVMSPNPQHPHKKAGVGRVDGEGYLGLLEQWDAQNRATDPARGAPPERAFLPGVPDMALMPPSRAITQPVVISPPTPSVAPQSDVWVASKPRIVLTPADPALVGPRVTETRGPVVVASGIDPGGAPIPAVAVMPTEPPAALPNLPVAVTPAQPEPLPIPPRPVDPKQPEPKAINPTATTKQNTQSILDTLFGTGEVAAYLRALSSNQHGYRIKVDQAVELGLINSREFQDRREDLYLAALPVTLERFNFATQAFFTEQVFRRSVGSQLTGAGEFWEANTTTGFGKRFPTGASVLLQFANQIVIDLSSNRPDIAVSNLSLSALQPFLRGGGLAVNLENLTATERNMIYAMRSYARFRKLFYVATVGGPTGGLGLTNNPYGLQGLSVNLGRGIGGNLTAPVVGFYPLLQQDAIIANQLRNVSALEDLLRIFEAYREGGQQAALQVNQVEVQLLNSRGSLLGQGGGGAGGGIRGYLDSLDNFKLQLGLPLTVGLDLDSTPLKPMRQQLGRFEDVYLDLRQLEDEVRKINAAAPAGQFRAHWRRLLTESELVKGTTFAKTIGGRWDVWVKLTNNELESRLAQLQKERSELLDRRADRLLKKTPEPEAEIRKLEQLVSEIELGLMESAVRTYEAQPWVKEPIPAVRSSIQTDARQKMYNAFYTVILDGRNERLAITRTEWPALPSLPVNGTDVLTVPLDEAYTAGIQAALSDRLDLMNARGQVVDAYRQVAVQANSLQGVFNVQYDLNTATPAGGNQAFGFSGDRARHQLTINAELPLVRRAERNNYRAALIGYQRQRRTLMAFEDNIANDVRNDIRELRTLAELYKIQQRVVELGYSQVDNARETQFAPLAAGSTPDAGTAAALTNQVLQAQSNLVSSQNQLFQIWVSYLTARMNLYLDLELMQLDDRGVWNDEQITGTDNAARPVPADGEHGERLPAPQSVGPADRR